jgi:Omp85 superfamily domain
MNALRILRRRIWIIALVLLAPTQARAQSPADTARAAMPADTAESLHFNPAQKDSAEAAGHATRLSPEDDEGAWRSTSYGDGLLTEIEPWHTAEHHHQDFDFLADYNRVDPLRLGFGWRLHGAEPYMPRIGARLEQAFGRNRTLYGAQFEQPLAAKGRIAAGVSLTRRTDHNDLQQISDVENSIAMLWSKADLRDYFEREGAGAYLAWRIPGFSTISAHVRTDQYRSLAVRDDANSLIHNNRPLRDNPAIDEGQSQSLLLRFERPTRKTPRARAGIYHWIEFERSGYGLGGDFRYTRGLADIRSVVSLSPAATMSLRVAAGHTFDGTLTPQKEFTLGGPDVLRAHAVDAFRGSHMALAQAEYDVALWRVQSHGMNGGLHALAFLDTGTAWNGGGSTWDVGRQKFAADCGIGLATSEDAVRIYCAKQLQDLNQDVVFLLRLQRPF